VVIRATMLVCEHENTSMLALSINRYSTTIKVDYSTMVDLTSKSNLLNSKSDPSKESE